MRHFLVLGAAGAAVLWGTSGIAQVVDPGVAGPARRGAAAVAPGAGNRIERREERRDDVRAERGNPNAAARNQARANDPRWYNNQWWYYTPKNTWMYYDNNGWADYDAKTYLPPRSYYNYGPGPAPNPGARGRYYTGYRGYWGPPASP